MIKVKGVEALFLAPSRLGEGGSGHHPACDKVQRNFLGETGS